jgi:PAT family acetyl-CoA transporter-like MFS transporter 1
MPKADIAMLSPALLVISIALPAYMGGLVAKRPLELFTQGVFCKVITSGLLWACGKYVKSYYGDPDSHSSHLFFGILFLVMILHEIAGNLVFVAIMTFFSTVSDPAIGGTYMTLLNTLANLGHKWPTSLALYILPKVSAYACTIGEGGNTAPCAGPKDSGCVEAGGICEATIDGFTVLTAGCMAFGGIWCLLFKSSIAKLAKTPLEDWRVTNVSKNDHSP